MIMLMKVDSRTTTRGHRKQQRSSCCLKNTPAAHKNDERFCWTTLLLFVAAAFVTVNLSLVDRLEQQTSNVPPPFSHSTSTIALVSGDTTVTSTTTAGGARSSTTTTTTKPDKQPLLDILKLAGISNVTDDEWESLPSWQQVVERFGDQPRIIGLETCETYRQNVRQSRRVVAPSGMFSTGTNLLFQVLQRNCVVRGWMDRFTGVDWQVNWGKHRSSRDRFVHQVRKEISNNQDVFPVVMVRDPWTWFQSMCKARYTAHWFHVPEHCPNFIPNQVEREWYNKTKAEMKQHFQDDLVLLDNVVDKANFTWKSSVVPVRVRYKTDNVYYESLAHFWKDWNQDYYDTIDGRSNTFPRLMIRMEDLVFFPQQVLQSICDCVGGTLVSHPVSLVGNTSKKEPSKVHGSNKTDLIGAMISHIYTDRSKGTTRQDIEYVTHVLKDSPVLKALGYRSVPS